MLLLHKARWLKLAGREALYEIALCYKVHTLQTCLRHVFCREHCDSITSNCVCAGPSTCCSKACNHAWGG